MDDRTLAQALSEVLRLCTLPGRPIKCDFSSWPPACGDNYSIQTCVEISSTPCVTSASRWPFWQWHLSDITVTSHIGLFRKSRTQLAVTIICDENGKRKDADRWYRWPLADVNHIHLSHSQRALSDDRRHAIKVPGELSQLMAGTPAGRGASPSD